jgi:hypothetical protein
VVADIALKLRVAGRQRRQRGEVAARGDAADRDAVRIQPVLGRIRAQPPHRSPHVVDRRRVPHRRDKAIVHARDSEPVRHNRHEALGDGVGLVAQRPGAAMEMSSVGSPDRAPGGVYRSSRSESPPTVAYTRSA